MAPIITYQVITGNYSSNLPCTGSPTDYNIPSNNRELQPSSPIIVRFRYYNIPSNNRELQPFVIAEVFVRHYNIPSNNRELQRKSSLLQPLIIITYQVITGNYSEKHTKTQEREIITYQVITGNYSFS